MAAIYALLPFVCAAVASAQQASPSVDWQNTTGNTAQAFPTDVGLLGPTLYGKTPFLAQQDKVNSTKPNPGNYGIELRFLPKDADKDNATSADIYRNLGQTSPYFPADDLFPETAAYSTVPKQCTIKQVHILHRHGARYPASGGAGPSVSSLGEKIYNASKAGNLKASGELAFLNSWNFSLGAEVLTHQGTQELFDSGVKHYYQYAKLLENLTEHKPVLRTTSQSRMIDSARYWALGFFGWDAPSKSNIEVLNEIKGQNDTLVPYYDCNNSFYLSDEILPIWRQQYLNKTIPRIQNQVQGVNFTYNDVYNMQSMCAYELNALGYSNFCSLFTKQEWEDFEYDIDISFQANNGFMNPGGKANGIGWVTEFLARLTNKSFTGPQSEQNSTIDKNSTYFPLDQPLYADFTHDVVIHSILTALNMTQVGDYLPTTKPDPKRRYRASRVTPFGARLVFEVMDCDENNSTTQYIRAKLNEAVVPLNQDQGCEKRPDGLCKLNDFIKYQNDTAFKASKFDLFCFGKNGTNFTVTGPVRMGALTDAQIEAGQKNASSHGGAAGASSAASSSGASSSGSSSSGSSSSGSSSSSSPSSSASSSKASSGASSASSSK